MSNDSFKAATTLLNMPLQEKKKIIKDLLRNFLLETWVVCTLCHIEDRGHLPGGAGFHLRLYTVSSRVDNYATVQRQSWIWIWIPILKRLKSHLFKQWFKIDSFCLPKCNLSHGAWVISFLQFFSTLFRKNFLNLGYQDERENLSTSLCNLSGPLENDSLDIIFEHHVHFAAIRFSNFTLFIINWGSSLNE